MLQGVDEASACQNTLSRSLQKNYDTLKAEHLRDYQELYTRLELDLGDGRQELPTDQRLLRYQGTIINWWRCYASMAVILPSQPPVPAPSQ